METADFWEGFSEALNLVAVEVDKIMATGYNDRRAQDELLDVICSINGLKRMAPKYEVTGIS